MRFLSALAVALAALGCSADDRAATPRAATPVKLVVLVVVDQLPAWVFARDLPHLRHGFARLRRDGAYVLAADLPYANPFTAPGHATIGTGAPPSVHGVLGNSWYRRTEGRERPAEYDADAPIFAVGEPHDGELSPDDAASGRSLRVEGIADAHRRGTGGRGRSVAISLKPRAAAFMTGRQPDLAIWYEAGAGGMTTTKAYASEAPDWLRTAASAQGARRFFARTWSADPRLAEITKLVDAGSGEGSVHGLDTAFPHELAATDRPARAFLHTSFADELVADTGRAAIEALDLGGDATPDLLALGFNAHDYAGHLWGPDSWEALQILLDLDRTLGTLFDDLDRRLGKAGWAVVLTSDHGMTPLVERSPHDGARRVAIADVARAAETAVAGKLGEGPWVAKVIANNIYFTPALAKLDEAARRVALEAATSAVAAVPGIARAGTTEAAAKACASSVALDRALCHAVVAGESGELYVLPAAGSLVTDYATGSHHDAPFDDNRRVPIFVMAPGVRPGESKTGATLLQVASTVASLLGVSPPAGASEPPLFGLATR